ncbi:tRNA guanosine(34) transglycosylase Tgt [Leptospirillum ferriphilum]|uniref:tRNA guanosine(34) transglycosylase Tgt n=1 Tax=Leptospirillum ferriphilum TaxID=178606 RepID=UPI003EE78B68
MKFHLETADPFSKARTGCVDTRNGFFETPAFMPVATRGTIRGLTAGQVREAGAGILLVNLFHLWLRPGEEIVREAGGISSFMGWKGPVLADSGGYQIYSLSGSVKIREEGAFFQSPYDGRKVFLSPEDVVSVGSGMGIDLIMVLDHLVSPDSSPEVLREARDRTLRWAKRSLDVAPLDGALFGIVQGGCDIDARKWSAETLSSMTGPEGQTFSGFGIGGLGIGEPFEVRNRVVGETLGALPPEKPRYLMGIGYPEDLLTGIIQGVDLFDCVLPTRNGRNGMAFTSKGRLLIRNARFQKEDTPLDEECSCAACKSYSRSYIHHLFRNGEMLGPILNTIHNLTYYLDLMHQSRTRIREGTFNAWARQKIDSLQQTEREQS